MVTDLPRILMVSIYTPPYFFAGAGNQAVVLSKALMAQGCPVSLITSHGEKGWVQQETLEGLPVFRLRGSRQKWVNVILFNLLSVVWWIFHARHYDIVHIHGATNLATLIWIPMARWLGQKSLLKITCSGVDDFVGLEKIPWLGSLGCGIARQADGFIALTPDIATQLKEDVPEDRVFLIPNGLDAALFHPLSPTEKQQLRQTLPLPEAKTILLYTGGINPRKNIHFLIEAVGLLNARYPQICLYLIGPCKTKFKPYQTQIEQQIHDLELSDNVFLLGEMPYRDIARYLQASDLFVFASTQEGLPSSPIEAMACGLPTVILHLSGVTDWLYEGRDVARVVTGNTREFADGIAELLKAPEKRETLGRHAAAYATKRFEASVIAHQYLAIIYPTLLGKTPVL